MNWTGAALIILGLFLILRTVRKDSQELTLVDRILGSTAHEQKRPSR